MKISDLTEDQKRLLKVVIEHFSKEDQAVRERQIRQYRRLKLAWDGFQRIWYSEVAHDWRVFDEQKAGDSDQSFYDKPINVFRAYLESIIAALSTLVPPITCYPEDADNSLDLITSRAGNKIAELLYRHNDVSLLWVHALYIFCTEGMTACYSYAKEAEEFGTYDKKNFEEVEEMRDSNVCPICKTQLPDYELAANELGEFMPGDDDSELHSMLNEGKLPCTQCMQLVDSELTQVPFVVTRLTGITKEPKSRICLEAYGGLYVKVASYAKQQKDTPYLIFSYETHYSLARDMYPDIRDKIGPGSGGAFEPYERWGRLNTQYYGEYPINNVTVRNCWLRPFSFEILEEDEAKDLKKLFPSGAKVVLINDEFAEAENECLDDCWTLTYNPLSDFLQHDPLGLLLVSIQEITNDLISMTLQTIEHGIPQTFASTDVLNFQAYRDQEVSPGQVFPVRPKSGMRVSDGFYEVKTATLSSEVLPFATQIQNYGQLVSGAVPSLFGGQLSDNKTASVYSMSRTQALQRLQNTWKIFSVWWKIIFSKAIPMYIKEMKDDDKYVEKDKLGNFVNVFIRKAELEGSIGRIELEANENLPVSWAQMKDTVMQLIQANNPQVLALIASPENLPYLYEAIGLNDLSIPGEDDRNKQYEEIKLLLESEPIPTPVDPVIAEQAILAGQPPPEEEQSSVEIDQIFDNHQIEFEIIRGWAVSDAGRLTKIENPRGYQNVLLHGKQHYMIIQQQMMMNQQEQQGSRTLKQQDKNLETPRTEDNNVKTES
jgi:hypothetical protein